MTRSFQQLRAMSNRDIIRSASTAALGRSVVVRLVTGKLPNGKKEAPRFQNALNIAVSIGKHSVRRVNSYTGAPNATYTSEEYVLDAVAARLGVDRETLECMVTDSLRASGYLATYRANRAARKQA